MKIVKILLIAISLMPSFFSSGQKANPLPESLVNFDINYSTQFNGGFLQWKAVVGSNNSGIVLGVERETIWKMGWFEYPTEKSIDPSYGPGRRYVHRLTDSDIDRLRQQAPWLGDNLTFQNQSYLDRGWTVRIGYQYGLPFGLYFNAGVDVTTNRTKDFYYVSDNWNWGEVEFYDKGWAFGARIWTGLGYAYSLGKDKRYYLNAQATYTSLQLTSVIERSFVINAGFGFRIGAQPKTTIIGATESNTVKIQR